MQSLIPALPAQGSEMYILTKRDLKAKLLFTAAERKKYKIKELADGNIEWSQKLANDRIIDLSSAEINILKQLRDVLNKAERMSEEIMPVIELIKNL